MLLPDCAATEALGRALAAELLPDEVVCLDGELGAGKTTLVRAVVAALGGDPAQVASPTYTLMHVYTARWPVVHVDAYRLRDWQALEGLGFSEACAGGVALVEWAARIADGLGSAGVWRIRLQHEEGGGRSAEVLAPTGRKGWGLSPTRSA